MLEKLKEDVFLANLELPKQGLIKYTWGNVSAYDKDTELFVIKPSGVSYEDMKPSDMVVVDLNCQVIEGDLNPSSDTETHAELYKAFPELGGIVHTHSTWATIWAQAGLNVPVLGTTHADTFYGEIPCTRFLSQTEIENGYEKETGKVIVETFQNSNIDPLEVPGVLVRGHGAFTWAKDAKTAVMNSVVLDEVCKMNLHTIQLNNQFEKLPKRILDKHYLRKHGSDAYYGQTSH